MPIGPPIDVYHSQQRATFADEPVGTLELSVSPGKLFFNLGETTGSIWAAEWK
jgi:hypothetical protein